MLRFERAVSADVTSAFIAGVAAAYFFSFARLRAFSAASIVKCGTPL